MKAGQLLAVAITQAAAFEGRQKKNRRLMARMGNVEGTLRASQANDRFGGKDGKNSPAECGVKIYPQKSAILMPIDVRIIDIPNRLNETMMTRGGRLRKALAQTLDIFRFDGQIDIRRWVIVNVLIISKDAIRDSFLVEDSEKRLQEFSAGVHYLNVPTAPIRLSIKPR